VGQLLDKLQELGFYEDSIILVEDPGERHNVIDEHPEVAQRLAAAFGSLYLKEVSAIKGIQGRYEVADSAAG
jgi:hypothetical protein